MWQSKLSLILNLPQSIQTAQYHYLRQKTVSLMVDAAIHTIFLNSKQCVEFDPIKLTHQKSFPIFSLLSFHSVLLSLFLLFFLLLQSPDVLLKWYQHVFFFTIWTSNDIKTIRYYITVAPLLKMAQLNQKIKFCYLEFHHHLYKLGVL